MAVGLDFGGFDLLIELEGRQQGLLISELRVGVVGALDIGPQEAREDDAAALGAEG